HIHSTRRRRYTAGRHLLCCRRVLAILLEALAVELQQQVQFPVARYSSHTQPETVDRAVLLALGLVYHPPGQRRGTLHERLVVQRRQRLERRGRALAALGAPLAP